MSAEIANPDRLMRIVGARCEKCDYVWPEDHLPIAFPIKPLSVWLTARHGYRPEHPLYTGPTPGIGRIHTPEMCGGRLLLSTEPAP